MSESLLASIHAAATGAQPSAEPAVPAAPAAVSPAAPGFDAAAAAEIAQLCATALLPQLTAPLIRQGASVEQARAQIAAAGEIRAAVDLARRSCSQIDARAAEAYIAAGTPIAQVRADLFEKMAAVSAAVPTVNQHQAGSGKVDAAAAWKRSVDKVNARITDPMARTA